MRCSATAWAAMRPASPVCRIFWRAIHHQNLAQGRALQALRAERGDFRLGTVISLQPTRPSPGHEADKTAVARFDAFWNGAFLDPLFKGFYPVEMAGELAPLVAAGDLETIKQQVDFLGVNYYAPAYVSRRAAKPVRRMVWRRTRRYALYGHGLAD